MTGLLQEVVHHHTIPKLRVGVLELRMGHELYIVVFYHIGQRLVT